MSVVQLKDHVEKCADQSSNNQNLKRRNKAPRRSGSDRRDASIETRITQNNCYIFRENETAQHAFLIEKGTVEIVKSTREGEVVIGTIGKGAIFGEMALIDNKQRMASAQAVGEVTVKVVTKEMIAHLIEQSNPFIRGLIRVLSDHARLTAETLCELRDFIHTNNFFGPDRRSVTLPFNGRDRRNDQY